ncbi:glutaredoxin family protein [Agaribacterium sp. ZY112]|uniref:glutaredoxin family protein n=1 Tax=Agaribacterium sp. ZY112 TaxID=3233574 RepID=UPI0035232450
MLPTLILYRSDFCPLCDEAMELCYRLKLSSRFRVIKKDITNDKSLMVKYAHRIPVLEAGASELAWPFDQLELAQWVSQLQLDG